MKANEIVLSVLCLVWFLFVNINVNPTLGQIYIGFTVGALLLYLFDEKKTIQLDKDGKWLEAIMTAGIVYVAFIIGTSLLTPLFEKIPVGEMIKLLAATAPALAASKILNIITFSVPIAYVETQFWVRLVDFFASRLKINTDKRALFTIAGIALISVFAFGFLMYHVTAKGLENNVALMLVFVMMLVSLVLAFWKRESKQAILFHIIANTVASLAIFGFAMVI